MQGYRENSSTLAMALQYRHLPLQPAKISAVGVLCTVLVPRRGAVYSEEMTVW